MSSPILNLIFVFVGTGILSIGVTFFILDRKFSSIQRVLEASLMEKEKILFSQAKEIEMFLRNSNECEDKYQTTLRNFIKVETLVSESDKRLKEIIEEKKNKEGEINILNHDLHGMKVELMKYHELERQRELEFHKKIESFNEMHQRLKEERDLLKQSELESQKRILEVRKKHWELHEKKSVEFIKNIARKVNVEFFDGSNFPLDLKPDASIKIADQFVIFDAKAPQDPERLENFEDYVLSQVKKIDKYIKQENVRKECFLVIPSETFEVWSREWSIDMKGYRVHIISVESVEPIINLLKKIEDYEISEQLTPEEKEDIATFIGKTARIIKRKVQIDHFFTAGFLELLMSEEKLPSDIYEQAREKEKSFIINPPLVKRKQDISLSHLNQDQETKQQLIQGQAINLNVEEDVFNQIPLNIKKS